MKGQFFIMGTVIILINLFILTHFITESRVTTEPPPQDAFNFVSSYMSDLETVFEDSSPHMIPKNLNTYRSISREKSAWSYRLYDSCGDDPCSEYSVRLNDCGLNVTLDVIGSHEKINARKYFALSGPVWWNDTWPKRIGLTFSEKQGTPAIEDTYVLPASALPSGIWVNSTRIVGDAPLALRVNDTNNNDIIDGDDTIHFNYELAPSGSRTYYLYYSTTGIWELPEYNYGDNIAILEDDYWGQGDANTPSSAQIRQKLSELGYGTIALSADDLAYRLDTLNPKVLIINEFEKFPAFASDCSAGCEGTSADIVTSLQDFILAGGKVIGPFGVGMCEPYYYSGGWQPYLTGAGAHAWGCTDARIFPPEFSNITSRDYWGGDNQNISITPDGANVFDLPENIDINCTAVVNTTGQVWFKVINATMEDAAKEWSPDTSCIAYGTYGDGGWLFSGTDEWLSVTGKYFDEFFDGIMTLMGANSNHVSLSSCAPQDKP